MESVFELGDFDFEIFKASPLPYVAKYDDLSSISWDNSSDDPTSSADVTVLEVRKKRIDANYQTDKDEILALHLTTMNFWMGSLHEEILLEMDKRWDGVGNGNLLRCLVDAYVATHNKMEAELIAIANELEKLSTVPQLRMEKPKAVPEILVKHHTTDKNRRGTFMRVLCP